MSDYEYIGSGQDDGMIIARSGGKVAFFETTPATVASVTTPVVSTAASQTTGGSSWGFATAAQANNLSTAVAQIRAALIAYGLLTDASS
jgi:hypothetical protein